MYKIQKLIVYRPSSYDFFKPICSLRPYVGGFINFIKDYIYPHTNLGNGRRNRCRNGCRSGRRNGCIYKTQKLINYRAGSCDYFKPIYSPRPYIDGFNNFVEEGDCSTYKTSRVA